MLRVTVELLPWGNPLKTKVLGVILIANTGEKGPRRADYRVRRYHGPTRLIPGKPHREGWVLDHARRQSHWALVLKAIQVVFGKASSPAPGKP
jgi:hypothetical protein